jgi:YggT family protein|tara:strand:+ start:168 stop:719 length:552 start_codon:yes stop_codon:yes gene_type:complete
VQLVYSLFDLLAFALIGATLLRGWMIAAGLTLVVQPGRFVVAVTDWLVQPLRRILPGGMSLGRWDGACVFAALILALAYGGLWTALLVSNSGAQVALSTWMLAIPVAALKMLARVALQGLFYLLLMYAVLSWVQPQSPAMGFLDRLISPVLLPFQRAIPRIGGIDLSALVLMLILQVLLGLVV